MLTGNCGSFVLFAYVSNANLLVNKWVQKIIVHEILLLLEAGDSNERAWVSGASRASPFDWFSLSHCVEGSEILCHPSTLFPHPSNCSTERKSPNFRVRVLVFGSEDRMLDLQKRRVRLFLIVAGVIALSMTGPRSLY